MDVLYMCKSENRWNNLESALPWIFFFSSPSQMGAL